MEIYQQLQKTNVPFVVFLLPLENMKISRIGNNEKEIGQLSTHHLLSLGYRRIACIRGYPDSLDSHERVAGYRQALREAKIPNDSSLIVGGNFTAESGQQAIDSLIAEKNPFTAVVASSDFAAIGAIQSLWRAGLRVPTDVSVVGCGDLDVGRYFNPPLTTIDQKTLEIGRRCMQMLFQCIENPKAIIMDEIIMPELIVRGSTAAPAFAQ